MYHVRTVSLTLLVGLGFTLIAASAPARQDKDKDNVDPVDKKPSGLYSAIGNMRSEGLVDAKVEEAKPKFVAFAQHTADVISWPKRYAQLQDPTIEVAPDKTLDGIFKEFEAKLLIPNPTTKLGTDRANYIRELGKALDDALKEVILKNPDRAVKVNATRLLAIACKSGAHAHYPTVTALIANPTIKVADDIEIAIPPEVRYYAIQAAGNLLSAYNLGKYNQIQGGYEERNHSNDDPAVEKLLAALEKAVLDPASVLGFNAEDAKFDENKAVAAYYRRQAVKSLGQCRFAMFPVKAPTRFPAIVLARVAVSDPTLPFPPRGDELAEAVIGICNMDPPVRTSDRLQYGNGMAEVIGTAVFTFGGDRSATSPDKVVPWRGSAARMIEAIGKWRARFDLAVTPIAIGNPLYDPDKANAFTPTAVPELVKTVYDKAKVSILDPIAAGNRPAVDSMRLFILQEARKGTEQSPTIAISTELKLTVPRKKV